MNAAQRTLGLSLFLALGFGLIAGCNGLIGADKPNLVDSLGGASGSGGAPTGCVLPSDCPNAQICLFKQCSKQCAADKDCTTGRCLPTDAGTACVVPASAVCKTNEDCPAGSQCKAKSCRSSCTADSDCLKDQTCIETACVGKDPIKDPGLGGSGGTGGTTGNGDSGAGGSGAEVEPGGGMSAGGAGGTGGTGGTGGMSDGTAVGTLSAACDKEGALACAGHAQRSQLICQGGTWKTNGTCDGTSFCDTTPGGNAGACQPILAECTGKMAGDHACRTGETDVRECGVDLVTATVSKSCMYVCSGGDCAGECHSTDKGCKAGNLIPQICQDNGTWQDQTKCGYQCDPASGKCIAAGCNDGVQNGDETGKDCGGSCSGCLVGGGCGANTDCVAPASAHCVNSTCAAASCTDGIKNGNETGPDCGGSCPGKCAVNVGCANNTDCVLPASGHCSSNLCAAAACGDGIQNGSETGTDCGGSCAADCPVGTGCGVDGDCASGVCLNTKCVACRPNVAACVNGTSFEVCSTTGVLGPTQSCFVTNGTGSCSGAGVCGVASCNAGYADCSGGIADGCETNINVPSSCGTTCGNHPACSGVNGSNPTCTSGTCGLTCNPGYGNCDAATSNNGCESNFNTAANCGTCAHTTSCTGTTPLCMGGTCVANPPYEIGQNTTAGGTDSAYSDNVYYVVPVSVPVTATLKELRVIGSATTTAGGQARMAIWADDGAGHPGAYITQSAMNISVTTAEAGGAPQNPTTLIGGKTYWVGGKFSGGVHGYQFTANGTTGYRYPQNFIDPSATNLSPFNVAGATAFTNTQLNLFLQVQTVPP